MDDKNDFPYIVAWDDTTVYVADRREVTFDLDDNEVDGVAFNTREDADTHLVRLMQFALCIQLAGIDPTYFIT